MAMRPKAPPKACLYCDGTAKTRGMCNAHYLRWIRTGDAVTRKRRPKGTGTFNKDGYRVITVNGKQVYEHRHVMELHLGRPLTSSELVHHDDEIKSHNPIDNLHLTTRADHMRYHLHPKAHYRHMQELSVAARREKKRTT